MKRKLILTVLVLGLMKAAALAAILGYRHFNPPPLDGVPPGHVVTAAGQVIGEDHAALAPFLDWGYAWGWYQEDPNEECKVICRPRGWDGPVPEGKEAVDCDGPCVEGQSCDQEHRPGCSKHCKPWCCTCCGI